MTTEELCKENENARLLLDGNLMFDGNPNAMIKGLKFHAHASFDFHETRKVCNLKRVNESLPMMLVTILIILVTNFKSSSMMIHHDDVTNITVTKP